MKQTTAVSTSVQCTFELWCLQSNFTLINISTHVTYRRCVTRIINAWNVSQRNKKIENIKPEKKIDSFISHRVPLQWRGRSMDVPNWGVVMTSGIVDDFDLSLHRHLCKPHKLGSLPQTQGGEENFTLASNTPLPDPLLASNQDANRRKKIYQEGWYRCRNGKLIKWQKSERRIHTNETQTAGTSLVSKDCSHLGSK